MKNTRKTHTTTKRLIFFFFSSSAFYKIICGEMQYLHHVITYTQSQCTKKNVAAAEKTFTHVLSKEPSARYTRVYIVLVPS